MENFSIFSVIFSIIAIIALMVFFFVYNYPEIFTWLRAWLCSNREEKVGLTKSKGLYNANGYLVHSESDIHLNASGSFKRFESVDVDCKITLATTSLMGNGAGSGGGGDGGDEWNPIDDDNVIPPQPLRPAPVPQLKSTTTTNKDSSQNNESERFCFYNEQAEKKESIPSLPIIQQSVSSSSSSSTSKEPKLNSPSQPDDTETIPVALKRAISCESVCSDSSVALGDFEQVNITGYLCIGLEYDSECCDLIVNVIEAKDLVLSNSSESLTDSYVKVTLLPDHEATIQTKIYRSSSSPMYKERFLFVLSPREQSFKSLCFYVYSTNFSTHTLVGEGEIRLGDISLRQPVTTWVTLTDTGQKGTEFGELMFSLSYLPTAERLTVVVVKARNLKFSTDTPQDSFVKVYLMQQNKKMHKKKTCIKKAERCPIFNEAMMFSVPVHTLSTIQLRLTVAETTQNSNNVKAFSVGHVIVGAQATGRSLNHWNQMLTALRRPVAMWHILRK